MSNLVNLNKFRKKKQRANKEQQAEENRVTFGRTLEQKKKHNIENAKTQQALDGHKLDEDKPSP
jgi:Domain of unknown function (DUF4169)